MSTLNALAQKHGITVPLRVSDCPKVLTIVKIDNQQVPDGQGGRVAADILTAKAENGTALHGAPQPGHHRPARADLRAGRRDRRQAGARQHVRV